MKRQKTEELLAAMLAKGANPNEIATGGYTPLLLAIEKNDPIFVKILLEGGARVDFSPPPFPSPLRFLARTTNYSLYNLIDPFSRTDAQRKEFAESQQKIMDAVSDKQLQIFQLLLEHGANPNQGENRFALGEAAMFSNRAMVKSLLEKGADPNQIFVPLPYFLTPKARSDRGLDTKTAADEEKEVNKQLAWKPKREYRPLLLASSVGDLEIVKLFLKAGADAKAVSNDQNNSLHLLAAAGRINNFFMQVDSMVYRDENSGFVQRLEMNKITAAINGLAANDKAVAEALIAAGTSIDAPNKTGKTPLNIAAFSSDVAVVDALMQAGAKPLKNTTIFEIIEKGRRQPFAIPTLTYLQHDLTECDRILMWGGLNTPNSRSGIQARNGRIVALNNRATWLKLSGEKDAAMVQSIFSKGANLEVRNASGLTPLMVAARLGQKEMVVTLLEMGANGKATNSRGETVATQVAKYGQSNFKALPLKQKPQTGKLAELWHSAEAIKGRESLIRYTLKQEDSEIIRLLQNSKSRVLRGQ